MLKKSSILERTSNGLDVFRHYIKGDWRLGRNFRNPLYDDGKNGQKAPLRTEETDHLKTVEIDHPKTVQNAPLKTDLKVVVCD